MSAPYDADQRVIGPLRDADIEPVIPPKSRRKEQRHYDKELYKARSLIENFFCKLKQIRAIATRYTTRPREISSPPSTSPQPPPGSIDDTPRREA